ncbi:hypothetical protein Bca101_018040 [Brassica carinata]
MEPKGNPNVPGDRKINKKTAVSSATVKPNSKSPASSPIVSSALSMKSKAAAALIHEEQGSYRPPIHDENPNVFKASNGHERYNSYSVLGAVLLTDGVFWFIIYPFLTSKEFNLDFHSVNAVFLLGETFLNSLWFPLFRISYFVLWTGVFVYSNGLFMLVSPSGNTHGSILLYMILYAAVGLMHVPCFGVFALIVKLKYMWFSKCFSEEP